MLKSLRYSLIAVCLLLGGCKSAAKKEAEASAAKPKRVAKITMAPDPRATSASNPSSAPAQPNARPVNVVSGSIREVNEALRFVILDFGTGKIPHLEQKLSVYRVTQKVAELRVSGPYRGTTVAADITAGEAKYGDIVRED